MALFGFGKKKNEVSDSSERPETENMEAEIETASEKQDNEVEMDASAYYNLAVLHDDRGNKELAFENYLNAAKAGSVDGQFKAALMYFAGEGTEKNEEQALYWMDKAALSGDEAAQEYLKSMAQVKAKAGQSENKQAVKAADEEQRKREEAARNRLIAMKINQAMAKDRLYVIYSKLTRQPYISISPENKTCMVYVYTSAIWANERVRQMEEKGEPAMVQIYEKKDYVMRFVRLYCIGVTTVVYDFAHKGFSCGLNQIVAKKPQNELPPEKRPIENPAVSLTMLRLLQESRKNPDHKDEEMVTAFNRIFTSTLFNARFLVPSIDVEKDGEKMRTVYVCEHKTKGTHFIPIFTDMFELETFNSNHQKLSLMAVTFEGLATMKFPDIMKEYVINPATTVMPLQAENLRQLYEKVQEQKNKVVTGSDQIQ